MNTIQRHIRYFTESYPPWETGLRGIGPGLAVETEFSIKIVNLKFLFFTVIFIIYRLLFLIKERVKVGRNTNLFC